MTPPVSSGYKLIGWISLGSALFLNFVLRLHHLHEPLHTDLTTYACVARELLQGARLYADAIDIKPPGIYWIHMLGQKLWGFTPESIVYPGIFFNLTSTLLVFSILKKTSGYLSAGLGAFFWVVASTSPGFNAAHPNTELFINTFILAAIWGLALAEYQQPRALWLTGCGLALASCFKTNAAAFWLAGAGYVLWRYKNTLNPKANRLSALWRLTLPAMLIWSAMAVYFFSLGTFADFFDVVFRSLFRYAANGFLNGRVNFFSNLSAWLRACQETCLLWILAGAWFWVRWASPVKTSTHGYLAAMLVGACLMIASVGGGYIIYYQVLLPSIVLMAAMALQDLFSLAKTKYSFSAVLALLFLTCLSLAWFPYASRHQLKNAQDDPDIRLANIFHTLTNGQESIYQWGNVSHLYFYSQRQAASGLILNDLLFYGPKDFRPKLYAKVIRDLEQNPPAYFVFTSWLGEYAENPVFNHFQQHYQYFGTYGKYLIFERRGRFQLPANSAAKITSWQTSSYPVAPWKNQVLYTGHAEDMQYTLPQSAVDKLLPSNRLDLYGGMLKSGIDLAHAGQWENAFKAWCEAARLPGAGPEAEINRGVYYENRHWTFFALNQYEKVALASGDVGGVYFRELLAHIIQQAAAGNGRDLSLP